MIRYLIAAASVAGAVLVGCGGSSPGPVACADLKNTTLAGATVLSATAVPAGSFDAPAQGLIPAQTLAGMPAFCRVVAQATPSSDSNIGIEVWIPAAGWNQKYMQVGTLAYAGFYQYGPMASALKRGYAIASTDTGHALAVPDLAAWAAGHPEKIVDWGWRAHKITTDFAKLVIAKHTAMGSKFSYFLGASNGGREGFMAAQRFPQDFDGYIIDGPANNWNRLSAGWVNTEQAQFTNAASTFGQNKLPAIQAAALAQCDAADGVTDGIVNDPRSCNFNAQALLCTGAETDACLTAPQIASLNRVLDGPRSPSTGKRVFPGYEPHGVNTPDWVSYISGPSLFGVLNSDGLLGNGWFGDFVRGTGAPLNFDFTTINFDIDVAAAISTKIGNESIASIVDAGGTDFSGVKSRGAKIILTTGWGDPVVPPRYVIEYYESVVAGPAFNNNIGAARDTFRLFMIPGGGHLAGPGAMGASGIGNPFGNPSTVKDAQHDVISALEAWVETGAAPDVIVGAKYNNDDPAQGVKLSRPLCVYPGLPKYKGSGNTSDAASFTCVDGPRGAYLN
ncbi:tannase/feruloyl esterase family alpha/beta hydrolase [Ramlibacter sp. WS9]|uniref:tannase/feruloyl esterase family alpha/beta hydrolase n=1 Tax=Ramlibacter sp. WS9 TaxID=1882741 RepID=UPI0011446AAF|nr:tannase/feruloyl esterase family alpha/beta hydrolase [Ramlibacter sp. WS9]ROZ75340.1 tannase/feruloyl esterase family alpha/beta hydrolase [Ramlibacter sp. WS9]